MSETAVQQSDRYRMRVRPCCADTGMDCYADLVCYIETVQVGMQKLRQSTVVFARAADKACSSVQHPL